MKLSCWWKKAPWLSAARGLGATAALLLTAAAPQTFDTRADPQFGDARPALRVYLAQQRPRWRAPQHFCVVGYVQPSGTRSAQVHWREGSRLILWEGASDPAFARDAIKSSRRDLDLSRDVVADEAAVAGSTYLVTRAWVRKVLTDCAAKGIRYTIRR